MGGDPKNGRDYTVILNPWCWIGDLMCLVLQLKLALTAYLVAQLKHDHGGDLDFIS